MNSTAGESRIVFVAASWHKDIVDQARDAFLAELATLGYPAGQVDAFEVPGAFEIPLLPRSSPPAAATPPSSEPRWWWTGGSTGTSSSPAPSSTA